MKKHLTLRAATSKILLLLLFLGNAYAKIDSNTVAWKDDFAVAKLIGSKDNIDKYKLTTTAVLRDNFPSSKEKIISQDMNYPLIKSDSVLFDALYA